MRVNRTLVPLLAPLTFAAAFVAQTALADSHSGMTPYTAGDLLSPCQESDNDARWGEAAETECEQYLLGFVGALEAVGTEGICTPEQNTADEVRWAFMRWVHGAYSARKAMPANEAVLEMLLSEFSCP